jgi:hypothetical protein
MNEHTPGPWTYEDAFVFGPEGQQVADFVPLETDGRLISAAPDLLAACEAALPVVEAMIEYPGDPCQKIADGIRAALDKARGRLTTQP